MLRSAAIVAFVSAVAVTGVVVAAPVPPPSEKERLAKLWGKTEGQGEFELAGKQLTVRSTIGRPNRDFAWGQRPSAPRTKHVVSGDFEITVCVLEASAPNKDAKNDAGAAETTAGLYIQGEASIFRYSLGQSYQQFPGAVNQNLQRSLRIEASYPRGGAGGSSGVPENGKSTYVRLTRKGKEILMSHSSDGTKWSVPNNPFKNIDMGFPDEVTVGVFFAHSTYQFAHATFDGFTITKPK